MKVKRITPAPTQPQPRYGLEWIKNHEGVYCCVDVNSIQKYSFYYITLASRNGTCVTILYNETTNCLYPCPDNNDKTFVRVHRDIYFYLSGGYHEQQ